MSKQVVVIGSGVGGLASACLLAKQDYKVTVLEKNSSFGGRNGQFKEAGFTFPVGPTWYLMPEVYENFFKLFGEKASDHLSLQKLTPTFRTAFNERSGEILDFGGEYENDMEVFEKLEPGSTEKIEKYLEVCKERYELAMKRFIYESYSSRPRMLAPSTLSAFVKIGLKKNINQEVIKYFSSNELRQLFSFSTTFLGTDPRKTPRAYSMLNHALYKKGVFYPRGGMYSLTKSLLNIGKGLGVKFEPDTEVKKILIENGASKGVLLASGKKMKADTILSNAGIPNTELRLLSKESRSYDENFWKKKSFSPNAVLIYLGVNGELPKLKTHNFIFSRGWKDQFIELSSMPRNPSIYLFKTPISDNSAPEGCSSLFIIVPLSQSTSFSAASLNNFARNIVKTCEGTFGIELERKKVYQKIVTGKDFDNLFGSYRQSMFGLNHIFSQTGPFRIKNRSKKINNLFYVGADTLPGIGVPMCLISAELVAKSMLSDKK